MLIQRVCVFCSSSNAVASVYKQATEQFGEKLVHQHYELVYGGGNVGLMGILARSVLQHNGRVTGVIPQTLQQLERAFTEAHELIITADMRERKAEMDARSDAFVALPGGIGTLEEIIEVITAKQLGYHQKPIIFLNTNQFYNPLFALFKHYYQEKFAKPSVQEVFYIANTIDAVFNYLKSYSYKTPEKLI